MGLVDGGAGQGFFFFVKGEDLCYEWIPKEAWYDHGRAIRSDRKGSEARVSLAVWGW